MASESQRYLEDRTKAVKQIALTMRSNLMLASKSHREDMIRLAKEYQITAAELLIFGPELFGL
jgi:hypothetical protein